MRFVFANNKIRRLYTHRQGENKYSPDAVDTFFEVMLVIKNAKDERDIRQIKGYRYEQLKGKRKHQHSLRLTDQWRLIVERQKGSDGRYLLIIKIEDYHP